MGKGTGQDREGQGRVVSSNRCLPVGWENEHLQDGLAECLSGHRMHIATTGPTERAQTGGNAGPLLESNTGRL